MKLRIKGNSIRFRLTGPEVERLTQMGVVENAVTLAPEQQLVYLLKRDASAKTVRCDYSLNRLAVLIPASQLSHWQHPDQIGISAVQDMAGQMLTILIEKDFACIDGASDQENADAFPNPSAVARC